jgi:hypothetical protein
MREAGIAEERLRENVAGVFGGAFILSLVVAFNLALFLGADASIAWGAGGGRARRRRLGRNVARDRFPVRNADL